jgi:DNA adenine methylase
MHQHPNSTATASASKSKPYLKWTGGKVRLLPILLPLLPAGSKRLIEPFVGAGSVFLGTDYDSYVINDANPDLVSAWVALQARPRQYIQRAAAIFVEENRSREAYLALRERFNAETDAFERAVLLPYLNRFGFNGLFRVNSKGAFNVPYGQPKVLPRFPWEAMEAASRKLERCTVLNGGFRGAIELAGEGDVVYCDPPYVDDETPSFTQYTAARFGMHQQRELVAVCEQAVHRGATVLISNHDTPSTRELYADWKVVPVSVRRSVSAKVEARGTVGEVVAILGGQ